MTTIERERTARDFNALVAAASDIVWRQEQPLAAVYATVLKAAGRAAASRFVERASHMAIAAAGMFDEAKHPRHPRGNDRGGEFAAKGPLAGLIVEHSTVGGSKGMPQTLHYLTADDPDGGRVGMVQYRETEEGIWIDSIAVREQSRGQGIAAALTENLHREFHKPILHGSFATLEGARFGIYMAAAHPSWNKLWLGTRGGGADDFWTPGDPIPYPTDAQAVIDDVQDAGAFGPLSFGSYPMIGQTVADALAAAERERGIVAAASEWHPPQIDELVPSRVIGEKAKDAAAAEHQRILSLIADGFAAGVAWDVTAPLSQKLLDQLALRAAAIADGIREPIARIIANAYLNGLSVPQTADAIVEGVDGLAGWQATMLARTDLIGLANGGSMLAARVVREHDPTALAYKQWLATPDERTRDHHREAHGQVVASSGKFDVGDAALDYPGDPAGPDAEVINCRCTLVWADTPAGLPGVGDIEMVASAGDDAPAAVAPTLPVVPAVADREIIVVESQPAPLIAALAERDNGLASAIESLAAALMQNTGPPSIVVNVPEQPAPIIHVAADLPPVNVTVDVPEQPAPVVEVTMPPVQVTVEAPPPRRIEFERDERGKLTAAEEVE